VTATARRRRAARKARARRAARRGTEALVVQRRAVVLAPPAPRRLPAVAAVPLSRPWPALGAAVAVATLICTTGLGGTALRTLLGVPLTLVLPGFALTALVWPRLGLAERAAVAVGVSLSLAALSGLVLDRTPLGLGAAQPALLGLVTLGAIAAIVRRDPSQPVATPGEFAGRLGRREALLAGGAAVVLAGALAFSAFSAAIDRGPGFTQAWLVPQSGGRLDVGLRSGERQTETYQLRLTAGGAPVREWSDVRLLPGQQWSATAAVPAAPGGTAELVVVRDADPTHVYRSLHVSLGGAGS
jgi:hypothetical protein